MNAYLYPISKALLHFPIISLILTIPYIIYMYYKYGRISIIRTIVLFLFYFYMLSAYYMTILPLPDPKTIINNGKSYIQLIPFGFVFDFIKETKFILTDVKTYVVAIKQSVFLQPIFNILLTVPFGVMMRYYFKKDIKETLVLTLVLSLFYEFTQLSGLYGIYSYPYRLFDIDDLILNSLGGVIGFYITRLFTFFLPSKDKLDEISIKKRANITYARRLVAFFLDCGFISLAVIIVYFSSLFLNISIAPFTIKWTIVMFIYITISTVLTKGNTLGKSLVRIKIVNNSKKNNILQFTLRYFVLYGVSLNILDIINFIDNKLKFNNYIYIAIIIVASGAILYDMIYSIIKKKQFFYERISNTINCDKVDLKNKIIGE